MSRNLLELDPYEYEDDLEIGTWDRDPLLDLRDSGLSWDEDEDSHGEELDFLSFHSE